MAGIVNCGAQRHSGARRCLHAAGARASLGHRGAGGEGAVSVRPRRYQSGVGQSRIGNNLEAIVNKITDLLGKKAVVSSELSMRQALTGVLFLSQSMGLIIAAVIGVFAAAFVWRATATRRWRAAPRNGDPSGHRMVLAAYPRAGADREPGAGGHRHRGWACSCARRRLGAGARLGHGRSALGFKLYAALHSPGHAQSDADNYRAGRDRDG